MYYLSHSKCNTLVILPLALFTHTHTHKNKETGINQGMLTQSFTSSIVPESKDDYYKTLRWCQ